MGEVTSEIIICNRPSVIRVSAGNTNSCRFIDPVKETKLLPIFMFSSALLITTMSYVAFVISVDNENPINKEITNATEYTIKKYVIIYEVTHAHLDSHHTLRLLTCIKTFLPNPNKS